MKSHFARVTRRRFLVGTSVVAPLVALVADAALEPKWLKTKRLKLNDYPTQRLVHFSDLHHKGDRHYLQSLVQRINDLTPNLVCFTGDLIEEGRYLPEALEYLAKIRAPLYGVPGNHDYWAKVPFREIAECFAKSGGKWLLDQTTLTNDGRFSISGAANLKFKHEPLRAFPGTRHILLMHYPAWVKKTLRPIRANPGGPFARWPSPHTVLWRTHRPLWRR